MSTQTRRRRDGGIEIVIKVSDAEFRAADEAMTVTPRQKLDLYVDAVEARYRRQLKTYARR